MTSNVVVCYDDSCCYGAMCLQLLGALAAAKCGHDLWFYISSDMGESVIGTIVDFRASCVCLRGNTYESMC
jgi:hypothetical protein